MDFFNFLMQELYVHAGKNEPYRTRKNVEAAYNHYQAGMKTYDPNTDHYFFQDLTNALHEILVALGKKLVLFIDEFGEWCKVVDDNERTNRRNERHGHVLRATDRLIDLEFMKFFSAILRNERFKERLVCIVAVKPFMAHYDVKRKLYLFRLLSNITLYYLDRKAGDSLIRDPLKGQIDTSADAASYLYELTYGHPYLIQLILNRVVNQIKGKKNAIELADIQKEETALIRDGSSADTHFAVLMSDYSYDVLTESTQERKGKELLAAIAIYSQEKGTAWVPHTVIEQEGLKRGLRAKRIEAFLRQFVRARILLEEGNGNGKSFAIAVPLLRKRLAYHNDSILS
jgi:hypothetical protein